MNQVSDRTAAKESQPQSSPFLSALRHAAADIQWVRAASVLILSMSGVASAQTEAPPGNLAAEVTRLKDQLEQQQIQIDAQSARIAQQRVADDRGWLDQQRADEIKALVQDVLADADMRASLSQNGLTAGFDKHFFIGSADGNFLMQLYMKLQTRFVYNDRDAAPGEDRERWGFEQRRTELYWNGHVISPDLTYKVKIAATRSGGSVSLDDAIIGYRLNDAWKIDVGQFKVPFLREYLISSGRQQAVERSFELTGM